MAKKTGAAATSPASFYTTTISQDPRFGSTERVSDVKLLEPTMRTIVAAIIADAQQLGINLVAFETYRSQARQAELFAQKASQLKTVGVHHYGLAADLIQIVAGEPNWKVDYAFLGHLAHAHKVVWGGDWGRPGMPHTFLDPFHVQRCTVARQPALFSGSWYPDASYNPYDEL